jgi:hypothetical protein
MRGWPPSRGLFRAAAGPDLDEAVPQAAASSSAFNREYRTPTPGPAILATRLRRLLAGGEVIALLRVFRGSQRRGRKSQGSACRG